MARSATRSASRWGLLTSVATAIRAALRPGSPGLMERLYAVPRLARATLRGDYPGASRGHLALLVAAVLYILSPVDVLPEAVLSVFGLADDAMVAAWLAASIVNDTEAFIAWERWRVPPAADRSGEPSGPAGGRRQPQDASESAWSKTVASHVVR